jgi:hypothetical protein
MTYVPTQTSATHTGEVGEHSMNTRQAVLIYGNSLFIAGVAAQLDAVPDLLIERIDTSGLQTSEDLRPGCPQVLIIDLATTHADFVLHCLMDCPNLMLVGLDLQNSRVVLLNSQFFPVTTLHDLTQVLQYLQ